MKRKKKYANVRSFRWILQRFAKIVSQKFFNSFQKLRINIITKVYQNGIKSINF